jgi:tetratricopeptide (TPR) repeat protein
MWASKMGKKCDPRIEAELLFRWASAAYRKGNFEKAFSVLEEAYSKDPESARRYLVCKGICQGKQGRLKEGIAHFTDARDEYHSAVLSSLVERNKPLPKLEPKDFAHETKQLMSFWQGLSDPNVSEPSSAALRKMRNAYFALIRGEDPDPSILSLRDKPGFENLMLYLMLLAAVQLRRKVRIRHLIANDPSTFHEILFLNLLDSHLLLLLKEGEYREIEILKSIFEEHHLRPGQLDRVMDELLFAAALDEIDAGRLETALDRLREIGKRTPSLIHNMALLYQKMGKFSEANENWITIMKVDGKPRRSDPEERRLAYAAAAKHIAANYLIDDQPGKAVHFLKEALSFSEDDREALEDLAAVSLELGEHQDAFTFARRLYDLDPQNEQYLIGYLSALLARGNVDVLLRLIEEHWEKYLEGSSVRGILANLAAHAAWRLRASKPEKARQIVALVREVDADIPHLIYLEGYFADKDGKRDQARDRFTRLIELTRNHTEQTLFGMAMHAEGFRDLSIALFTRLIDCGCEASEEAFEDVIGFLAQKNDHDAARELCLYAVDRLEYPPYAVADILFTAGKPHWAREFSEQLFHDPDSGVEEYFLHLLILNDIGNPAETIVFAESMKKRMENSDDLEFLPILDYVIKQLKTKGRVKIPYG